MKNKLLAIVIILAIGSCQAQKYKFAVLCDTRSDANNSGSFGVNVSGVKAVCEHLKQSGAEFVLAPGDLICGNVNWYKPSPPSNDVQLQTFLNAAKSAGVGLPGSNSDITIYPVRGNHECYCDSLPEDSLKAAWERNIGSFLPKNGPKGEIGYTYSFEYNGSLFIGLDQYMHAKKDQKSGIELNQEWLDNELKKYPNAKHVFTFGHTPAFSANHKDCLGEDSIKRNTFLNSISNKTQVYFCGHDHFYARAKVPVYQANGKIENYIHQIITPSGAPFLTGNRSDNHKWSSNYKNKDVLPETYIDDAVGYQLVEVDGNKVTITFFATMDASTHTRDKDGVYTYKYNDNWESWNFVTMDKFTYYLNGKKEK
jgi:hypothetical protein